MNRFRELQLSQRKSLNTSEQMENRRCTRFLHIAWNGREAEQIPHLVQKTNKARNNTLTCRFARFFEAHLSEARSSYRWAMALMPP